MNGNSGQDGPRRVFLDPLWKLHVGYHVNELAPHPPEGYRFIMPSPENGSLGTTLSKMGIPIWLFGALSGLAPLNLLKSSIDSVVKRIPESAELLYCCHHVSFRRRPWVVEMDAVWDPLGPNVRQFRWWWRVAERALASDSCRRILVFSEFSKATILPLLSPPVRHKVITLPRAVRPKAFVKKPRGSDFSLLFMGSANLAGMFEMRGGRYVLEAFRLLSRKHSDLTLTIRSDIPREVAREYADVLSHPRVLWSRKWLSDERIEELYTTADALLLPGHYDNWLVTVEAMSYQLPIITTDIYSNSERVINGHNGLLVRPARHVPYYQGGLPLFGFTPKFQKAIARIDPDMVGDIVEKVSTLVEDRQFAASMGEAARGEVENGKFSLRNRNDVLKMVFDTALGVESA